MAKIPRKNATYFKKLPDADPTAEAPISKAKADAEKIPDKAVEKLLPSFGKLAIDELALDDDKLPVIPSEHWEHLVDDPDTDVKGGKAGKSERRSLMATLIAERTEKSTSPGATIDNADIAMKRTTSRKLHGDYSDAISRLRQIGRQFAKQNDNAQSPVFHRTVTQGVSTVDWPLPGTSFAHMGIRGSFGRSEVNSAKIEHDRLFMNKKDVRHVGNPDVTSGPLNIDQARGMKPGERFAISAEQSVLVEAGLKYTPSPMPWVTSSALHDLGPSAMVDMMAAVEGETSIEIVRGFGSKVAVVVSARDERATPGDDRSWKASFGAFFDGSIIEYATQAFRKLATDNMEDQLAQLEDKKRNIDLRITPAVDKFNDVAGVHFKRRTKDTSERVRLYEVVLDLDTKDGREVFESLAGHTGEREIDFGALEGKDPSSGVELVTNNVKHAARQSIERTFSAFGYLAKRETVTEKSDHERGGPAWADDRKKGRTERRETHGEVRETKTFSEHKTQIAIGRVKTMTDEENQKTSTGIGLGLVLKVDDGATSVDELAGLLSLGKGLSGDGELEQKFASLIEQAETLPRRKLLGLPVGARGVGKTETSVHLEVNSKAVARLFEKLDDEGAIYKALAEAYGEARGTDAPAWPIEKLDDDGWFSALKRKMPSFTDARSTFLTARSAVRTLQSAKETPDPVEAAQLLSQAFAMLGNDLELAGALLKLGQPGVEIEFSLEGAEQLAARAERETSAATPA